MNFGGTPETPREGHGRWERAQTSPFSRRVGIIDVPTELEALRRPYLKKLP